MSGSPRDRDPVVVRKVLLILCDALACLLAFYASFYLRNALFGWRGGVYVATIRHVPFILGLTAICILYFRHNYLYRNLAFKQSLEHLETLLHSWLVFGLVFIAVVFLLRIQLFSEHRISTAMFLVLGGMLLYVGRFLLVPRLARHYVRDRAGGSLALAVGGAADAERVAYLLAERGSGARLLGWVSAVGEAPPQGDAGAVPCLGSLRDIPAIIARGEVDEVFVDVAGDDAAADALNGIFAMLEGAAVRVRVSAAHFAVVRDRVPYLPEVDQGYVFLDEGTFGAVERRIKTGMDRVLSACALVALAPVLVVIATWVRLDSPGPVLFRQRRVGKDGKPFTVLKFRTMRENTEAQHRAALRELMASNDAFFRKRTGLADFYKATDPRQITGCGRFLRRSSLDELPQLLNVLRGEMSLIGPRPLPLYEVEHFKRWHHYRHRVLPGISGYWQVFGRSAVSYDNMMLMDIFYITNWSLALDLRILARTVLVMLTGRGGA